MGDTDEKTSSQRSATTRAQTKADQLGLMPRVHEAIEALADVERARATVDDLLAVSDAKIAKLYGDNALGVAEIGHVVGLPEGTVRSALNRA